MKIELFTKEQSKQIEQFWNYAMSLMQNYFKQATKVVNLWFPIISEVHRAEVKRVHTAYHKKRGKRW